MKQRYSSMIEQARIAKSEVRKKWLAGHLSTGDAVRVEAICQRLLHGLDKDKVEGWVRGWKMQQDHIGIDPPENGFGAV